MEELWGFYCFPRSTKAEGDACENDLYEPACGPRLICVDVEGGTWGLGECVKTCCINEDCDSGETCTALTESYHESFAYLEGDRFGFCKPFVQPTGDPCGEDNPWPCNPMTSAECTGEDQACAWSLITDVVRMVEYYTFFCVDESTEAEGAMCEEDQDGPFCGPGLICIMWEVGIGECMKMCCSDEDCDSGETCTELNESYGEDLAFIEGKNFGFCE